MKHEIGLKGRRLTRSKEGDGRTVEGIAVPFGDIIDVWGERETFDPDTVFEGLDNAKLYYQHDTLIGSITNGENREDGLHITARIADTQQGRDAVALLDEGALDSLSVGFVPLENSKDEDGVTHRRRVRLLETSLVSWPAYENAKITNHRNKQEGKPMDEELKKLLDSLQSRQDEQADSLRSIETTLTSRLEPANSSSPLSAYRNQGELVKALVSDDQGKADAARQAYTALLERDYTGSTVADVDPQPTWINDRIRLLEQKRRIAGLLTHETLPAEGMTMSYLVLKTDTTTVGKQAKEGDPLPFGKITFGDESATIDTYGGYGDLTRQRIDRMPASGVNYYMRALTNAYAKATEAAARTALYGAIAGVADADKLTVAKTAADMKPNDWLDLIIDAAAKFDDVNASLDYIGVSPDVFKQIAHLTDEGDRFLDVSGQGATTLGSLDPAGITGRLLRRDVNMLDGAPEGTVVFMDKTAVTMWESGGAPFQLQADNIINLTRQFSVYGYAAFGTTFKQGILPVKFSPKA
ncbi:HK97 family phage prohead protease [Bifidobacterium imperatoris]|uniref:HK97 family phage prohead protease n=1 Tax=Bifidobacterium imperatoris TaxID=2020965 RepID=A0A2N5IQV7_9BIFI|nr:HK97 family phage prohead protease [Bifidobacterium imperatoris]PLS24345.1 phage prohead protease HK97 family [Bifidobacterium imperatoris]QSY56953.1 HK97 family phage prohead protease [Bifidobacterium imperatoris]